MSECKHTPYNWDLVYQCKGCSEIVPAGIAEKHENQLEEHRDQLLIDNWEIAQENAKLKRALHELAQFDYRLGIDAMRKFAFDALPADTQEGK